MNLPNGFGSVYKLSGKRRRPWTARKTVGWTFDEEKGKSYPIYQFIGYFEKRQEAMEALVEFNRNPFDLKAHQMTFEEVYEKWSDEHFKKVSQSNINGIKASYKLCDSIRPLKICDIKLFHLQQCVDQSGKNKPTLKKLKGLFSMVFEYAIRNEILSSEKKDMVSFVDISNAGNPDAIDRKPFTKEEIQILWDHAEQGLKYQIPLILIYSGLRVGELWNLKKSDVNFEEQCFFVGRSKTDSGIRYVPIADKILPFFKKCCDLNGSEWVFPNKNGNKHTDKAFRESWWQPVMDDLGMDHRPHDTRHTCVSLLTEAGVDERIIKKIVGHKGEGVTQVVYTHIDMVRKLEAINRI